MNKPAKANMVLVYDLRRDRSYREQILLGVEDQWQAYLRGERAVSMAEGRISRLFDAPHQGPMFQIDEGIRRSSWVRQGDKSWYAVGLRAKVESVVFQVPDLIGEMPVVTRIWIGTEERLAR
jgi:hypothetical protein